VACLPTDANCLSASGNWGTSLNTSFQLRIWSQRYDVAWDLTNATIIGATPSAGSPTVQVSYSAADIFAVYNLAFVSNVANGTTYYSPLEFLVYNTIITNSYRGRNADIEYQLLRNVIALPMTLYNWGEWWNTTSQAPPELHVKGYLANVRFRLIIAEYSLWLYMVLAAGTCAWCLFVLLYCWFKGRLTPNESSFPEWDFAARCVVQPTDRNASMKTFMKGLANANNEDIQKRIRQKKLYLGAVESTRDPTMRGSIALATSTGLSRLHGNEVYG